jgi:hypothetical protein
VRVTHARGTLRDGLIAAPTVHRSSQCIADDQELKSASGREALSACIAGWHGPRPLEYAAAPEHLGGRLLPQPLYTVAEYAGR